MAIGRREITIESVGGKEEAHRHTEDSILISKPGWRRRFARLSSNARVASS